MSPSNNLPQQHLFILSNLSEFRLLLGRLSTIPESLVCLCASKAQVSWLKNLEELSGSAKKLTFLVSRQLCQGTERRRHLHRHRNSVWLIWPFEFFWQKEIYWELAEQVSHIWAVSWSFTAELGEQWRQAAASSTLSPFVHTIPSSFQWSRGRRWVGARLELEFRDKLRYQVELGRKKACVIYQGDKDLRKLKLWARSEELQASLELESEKSHLYLVESESAYFMNPDFLQSLPHWISDRALKTFEGQYIKGLRKPPRFSNSLIGCALLALLIIQRKLRWL